MAKSSLLDDRTVKWVLYEDMGIAEYWIVKLDRALQTSRTQDQSQVGAWLMAQFQASDSDQV